MSILCFFITFLHSFCSFEFGVAGINRTDLYLVFPFLNHLVLFSCFFLILSVLFQSLFLYSGHSPVLSFAKMSLYLCMADFVTCSLNL